MPFRLEDDAARRLVRVTFEGRYERPEIEAMVSAARAASAKNGWNILYNMGGAIPGAVGPADVFWMPRKHPALKGAAASTVRVATVHGGNFAEIATFWETSFRNAGLRARAFTDEAAALEWLAIDEP